MTTNAPAVEMPGMPRPAAYTVPAPLFDELMTRLGSDPAVKLFMLLSQQARPVMPEPAAKKPGRPRKKPEKKAALPIADELPAPPDFVSSGVPPTK